MFLVTGLVLYVKAIVKRVDEIKENTTAATIIIIQVVWLLMGSLWLFLLLVFFGIEI